jgi:hypothetical protein
VLEHAASLQEAAPSGRRFDAVIKLAALAATLAAVAPRPAAATSCADEAVSVRAHLELESRRARRWNTAWVIAFGGAAVVQGTLAVTETKPFGTFDRDYEETLYVGAAKATIGAAARLVLPLHIAVPAASADPCSDLPALRDALADAGRRERRTFWLTHLGGLALNLAGAALLTYRRSFSVGVTSFLISFPIGPTSAYTEPRRSWHRWRESRASWSVSATTDGAMVWLTL